jgi:membrane-associated phospholipid phosphatase
VKIDLESLALVTIDICTQTDDYILQDGFKSFPSGHSSGMLGHGFADVLS